MIYAVRLGPVAASTPPVFAYVAFLPARDPEVLEATTDPQGLVALRTALKGQPFTCEPALAEAAGRLGLPSGPLPPAVASARAQIAYELAAGVQHGASRPDALAAVLTAAARLWAGRVWEVVAPDEPLRVAFAAGQYLVQGEVVLDASNPSQPRLVLCDEREAVAKLAGLSGEERVARLVASAGLVVELSAEPAWAAEILREAFRLPRIPTPERRRGGRIAPVTTQDLVMAAALMQAVVAFAERGDDGEVEVEVQAASLKVKARLGLVEHDPKALQEVFPEVALTPVAAGGSPQAPASAPAPAAGKPTGTSGGAAAGAAPDPAATGSSPARKPAPRPAAARAPAAALPEVVDDSVTPEQLAALLKGGEEAEPPPAPPARAGAAPAAAASAAVAAVPDVVDDSVSPEQLAALLKGGEEVAPAPASPARAAGTPAVPASPVPAAVPDVVDDSVSPEQLAALLKGGDEPALARAAAAPPPAAPASPAAPPTPDVVDDSVSPEQLEALLKGSGAAPPPQAAAVPAGGAAPRGGGKPDVQVEARPGAAGGGAGSLAPAAGAPGPAASAGGAQVLTSAAAAPDQAAAEKAAADQAAANRAAAEEAAAEDAAAEKAAQEAATPEAYRWKPLHAVVPGEATSPAPPPAAPAAPAATAPAAPAHPPAGAGEGWLARTWRALRAPKAEAPQAPARVAKPAARPPARPETRAAPPARRPPAPAPAQAPEPPPDPAGPFAPFARLLRIEVPSEPPPVPPAEAEQSAALAKALATAAAGRDRFVSFPAVAFQIVELVHSPKADAREVAGFISRDPGLAADVLAVANSAAFRGVSEAASVRDAVARLGLMEVGRIASAVSARALLVPAVPGAVPSTRLFSRAVAVATAASTTALRVRGARTDHVWLAGLLHDVGLALGASALAAAAGDAPASVAERALEEAHVAIGTAALRAWGLPHFLGDVCARHHAPEVPADPALVDLHLVRLTSALSRLAEPEVAARSAREIVQSAGALGLDPHAVRALAAELKDAERRSAVLLR